MPFCVVKWCIHRSDVHKKDSGITFHVFPQDENRRWIYIKAVRLERQEENLTSSKRSLIFSIHFRDDNFYETHKGYGQPGAGQPQQPGLEMGHGPYPSIGAGGTIAPQVQQWFRAVDKDQSGFITAPELKSALVNAQGQTFSETACNLMIGMFDKDRSGHINIEEFDKLYTYINQWLAVFKTYDLDQSGCIDGEELSKALNQMGFRFSPDFISFLSKRADPKEGKISVDSFIVLCVQMQRFTEAFRVRDTQQNGTVTIGFEDFLNIALSCSI